MNGNTKIMTGAGRGGNKKLIMEPNFRIMIAMCQLVLVQHENEEMTRLILRFSGGKNCLLNLIKTAINFEIESTISFDVLFREESVATKLMSSLFFSPWGSLFLLPPLSYSFFPLLSFFFPPPSLSPLPFLLLPPLSIFLSSPSLFLSGSGDKERGGGKENRKSRKQKE